MLLMAFRKSVHIGPGLRTKTLRVMKLTTVILLASLMQVNAKGYSQINLSKNKTSLNQVFREIKKQTGYNFLYRFELLENVGPVSVALRNASLSKAMEESLKGTGLTYEIMDKTVIIKKWNAPFEEMAVSPPPPIDVRGRITDEEGNPVVASIIVKGTNIGTTTNSDGYFELRNVDDKATLIISGVSIETREINIDGNKQLNVTAITRVSSQAEVVVTALGVGKSSKSITYATQNVSAEEVTRVKDVSFINSMAGKVAGAVITKGNFGPGSSTKILLRGDKSFTGNSEPLYVMDGAPMYGGSGLLANLNPEDIESIQIMKGASAAALYGSQAANGVVLITTKKGSNIAPRVSVSSNYTVENAIDLPKLQTSYGQADPQFNDSWGPKITNGSDAHLKEFFKTGRTSVNALSLTSGSDLAQVYLSYANTHAKGILPKNDLERNNFIVRASTQLFNKRLTLDGSVNFTNQKVYNQNSPGGYSALPGVYSFPVGDDWSKYSGDNYEVWDPVRQMYVQNWPYIRNETFPNQNPYWVQNRNQNDFFRQHTISSFTSKFKITGWLNIQARGLYDRINDKTETRNYASTQSTVAGPNGGYATGRSDINYFYSDLLLIGNKYISDDISLSATLGASNTRTTSTSVSLSSTIPTSLLFPNYFSVFALNGPFNKSESHRTTLSQAIFGNATLGYRNRLFLDVTARNEWSSTVSQSFFYPSVGLSYVLLENPGGEGLSPNFIKLRASYAEVGNSLPFGIQNWAPPYSLDNNGNILGRNVLPFFDGTDTTNLKPERTRSYEVGAEMRFFDNRLGINLTYYNATTFDQVFTIAAPAGAGASNFWINGGTIRNKGFEGIVSYKARSGDFLWTPSISFSRNKNQIRELSALLDADRFVLTSFNSSRVVAIYLTRPKDGHYGAYGDLYGKVYEKDEHGNLITNNQGLPVVSSTDHNYIGNSNPDFLAGFNNGFTYKNFNLSFLIDSRFGGGVVSRNEIWLDYKGLSKRTGDARDNGGVAVNGETVDAKAYYINQTGSGASAVASEYYFDATNVRLRELAVGYALPIWKSLFKDISFSLIGRNLFFLYKNAPFDPEIAASTSPTTGGIASFTLPATRSFGLSLRVIF